MRRWHAIAAIVSAQVALVACSAILGLEPPAPDGGTSTGGDATTYQKIPCAFLDAQVPDATVTTWLPFNSSIKDEAGASLFTFFDLTTLGPPIGNAALGFAGGAFDGTNIYLVASAATDAGLMLQHPTSAPIETWTSFDFGTLGIPKEPYTGATFDGRYVYYASRGIGVPPSHAHALRYDTEADASFSQPAAWAAFDVDTAGDAGKPPQGFAGAVFDGRYVYFAPYNNGTVARYDTKPPASDGGLPEAGSDAGDAAVLNAFDTQSHWSAFDTSTLDNRSTSYNGAVFDGRFVYFVPYNSVVLERYDTTNKANFGSPSAWSSYELDTLPNAPKQFAGAVYDGQYIYLVPHSGHIAIRYDSSKGFTGSAFTEFDISTVVPGFDAGTMFFDGGAFDGRFVYFIPAYNLGGEILRYDTLSPFTAPCAWEAYDLAQENAQLANFFGGVFDGHYLYFVPAHSMVVRYETKSPAGPLPDWGGSFF